MRGDKPSARKSISPAFFVLSAAVSFILGCSDQSIGSAISAGRLTPALGGANSADYLGVDVTYYNDIFKLGYYYSQSEDDILVAELTFDVGTFISDLSNFGGSMEPPVFRLVPSLGWWHTADEDGFAYGLRGGAWWPVSKDEDSVHPMNLSLEVGWLWLDDADANMTFEMSFVRFGILFF